MKRMFNILVTFIVILTLSRVSLAQAGGLNYSTQGLKSAASDTLSQVDTVFAGGIQYHQASLYVTSSDSVHCVITVQTKPVSAPDSKYTTAYTDSVVGTSAQFKEITLRDFGLNRMTGVSCLTRIIFDFHNSGATINAKAPGQTYGAAIHYRY